MLGRTIGNYVVQKKIGEGGMGAVYLAAHPRIQRQVAIKVLLPQFSQDAEVVARFFTEAKATSEIHNEHIIDIIDYGETGEGGHYITMEWLDGKSLSEVLKAGPMETERVLHVARGIGRALAAAHERGIVHRDLKPDNIFLIRRGDDPDFAKVLDFGIAKLMQDDAGDVKTKTGALIGTPSYMSPEQCRGNPVDRRSDIYSFGVIVYQMLTGRLPFVAEGLGNLLWMHMMAEVPPPRTLVPTVPPQVEQAVLRALAKEPEQRFQKVAQFVAALEGRSLPDDAVELGDTFSQTAGEVAPAGRRRSLLWTGGLAVVALAGAGAFLALRPRAPTPTATTQPAPVAATTRDVPTLAPPAPPQPAPPSTLPSPTATPMAHVSIRVEPAEAKLLLDEAPIPNPFDGDFPKNGLRRRLVAQAPGYHTEARWLVLDGDQHLALALAREHAAPSRPKAPPVATTQPPPAPSRPVHSDDEVKPLYKGTKGKLITDNPYQ